MTTDVEGSGPSQPDQPNEAELEEAFHEPAQRPPTHWEVVRDRFLIPLLLPLVVVSMVVLFAVNVSRFFLASAKKEQPAATEQTQAEVAGSGGTETQEVDKSVKQPGPVVIITILSVGALAGAAAYSASRHMRKGTSALIVGGVVAVVFVGGQIVWSAGQPPPAPAAPAEPTGPVVATIEVDALPSNQFQATEFTTKAGVNEIKYIGKGGNHTLVFASGVPGFELAVNGEGSVDTGKAQLNAGTYEIYCTVPGHKAAGMDAKVIVNP